MLQTLALTLLLATPSGANPCCPPDTPYCLVYCTLPTPPDPLAEAKRVADGTAADISVLTAGWSLDTGFTALALNRCTTCREANPLGFDAEARISLTVFMTSGTGWTCYKLRRGGHHRTATILRWTVFGIQVLAAGNNAIHAIRRR